VNGGERALPMDLQYLYVVRALKPLYVRSGLRSPHSMYIEICRMSETPGWQRYRRIMHSNRHHAPSRSTMTVDVSYFPQRGVGPPAERMPSEERRSVF
jgi:hypothetical protein